MMDVPTRPRPSPGGQEWALVPHPDFPSRAIRALRVAIIDTIDDLLITYSIEGGGELLLPQWQSPARANELWKTTCFELFLQPEGSNGYFEFNFSPSLRWAAYQFDGPRTGMRAMQVAVDPHIELCELQEPYKLQIDLELDAIIPNVALHMGLSAVIEETDGTKSYWALAHAPGPPDFHNRDCFIATLPAPEQP